MKRVWPRPERGTFGEEEECGMIDDREMEKIEALGIKPIVVKGAFNEFAMICAFKAVEKLKRLKIAGEISDDFLSMEMKMKIQKDPGFLKKKQELECSVFLSETPEEYLVTVERI